MCREVLHSGQHRIERPDIIRGLVPSILMVHEVIESEKKNIAQMNIRAGRSTYTGRTHTHSEHV